MGFEQTHHYDPHLQLEEIGLLEADITGSDAGIAQVLRTSPASHPGQKQHAAAALL